METLAHFAPEIDGKLLYVAPQSRLDEETAHGGGTLQRGEAPLLAAMAGGAGSPPSPATARAGRRMLERAGRESARVRIAAGAALYRAERVSPLCAPALALSPFLREWTSKNSA